MLVNIKKGGARERTYKVAVVDVCHFDFDSEELCLGIGRREEKSIHVLQDVLVCCREGKLIVSLSLLFSTHYVTTQGNVASQG